MATTLSQVLTGTQEAKDTVKSFLTQFEVGNLLRKCRAHKIKGFPVLQIFIYLLECMFSPISTYMSMKINTYKEPFSKNTIYRFCNDAGINWHKFLRLLSECVIRQFMRPATSDKRIEYFVVDDTPLAKTGKKSELVAKFFNHVNMTYQYGFRILTLIWTDEYSSVPIDFCPLSSGNSSLLRCSPKKCDGRSIAGQIRKQSQQKAPDIILDMLKKAIRIGHSAQYVLFDSWFSTPKGITAIKKELALDVIAMLKKSSKVFYEYQGKQVDIKKIYSMNRKRPGKSKYLLSVQVNLIQNEKRKVVSSIPARIVYVRNKSNRKDWIALISTDLNISEEEIIRRYGARWNIEVYFKTCKQYLKLQKECNSPSFDAFTCHLTIVAVRYMILSVQQRSNTDDRTIGELFWIITAEVVEISYLHSLGLILDALLETVREFFRISDEQMIALTRSFFNRLPEHLQTALCPEVTL
ncbi:MAG: transposase [Oscillospiraceae bacterium]|nr:transposase [Oscillospiraceae bacterium]